MIKIVHEAGKGGIDVLSFVYIAPKSPSIGAIVSYIVVYLLAGWVLGGYTRRRDGQRSQI